MLSSRPVKSDSISGSCVRSWSLVIVSGPILVRLRYAGGDERLNVAETPGSRGRAVQEPQHVLGKGLRVQEVGHVLLPGQDRDETLRQLDGLPPFRPAGQGPSSSTSSHWDSTALRSQTACLSSMWQQRPMRGWGGDIGDRHVPSCSRTSRSSGLAAHWATAQGIGGGRDRELSDPSSGSGGPRSVATGDHRSWGRGLLRRHTGLRRTDPIQLTDVLLVWLAGGLAGRLRHGPAAHPWLSLHCSRPAEAPCDRPSRLTFVLAWPTICAMSSIGTPAYHRLPQEVDNGHPWLCRGWRRTGADPG